uniref:Uncharacterized protein n=1 Tax=Ananas comosus var. bracteatus TaxID=296719 RepID=A0A6V7NPA2_ANACO|nr:unnamed protein product [Ananas comosus var. bracteatus]
MPVEKSGWLSGTPPKASVMPMKGAAEDTSGVRDDDDSDDDGSIAPPLTEGRSQPFKVEAKIEIPNYDGIIDAEKLDAWLDQLETYFDLYNYSNAEKEFYPMGYEEERWKRWHVLRQSATRQCTTTPPTSDAKPWRLASPLMIHRSFVNTPRAYSSASMMSFASRRARQSRRLSGRTNCLAGRSHLARHVKNRCWKLHLELRPKKKDDRGEILYTFTILTTRCSAALEWLHDRMPVILGNKDSIDIWLNSCAMNFEAVLRPYEGPDLVWYPVTPAVGKRSFDCPECIKEVIVMGLQKWPFALGHGD